MRLFKYFLILLIIFFNIGWSWPASLSSKNKQANKLYKEGKVDEALSRWRDAQIENPESGRLHYNIGNGLYEQKKYEDAFKEYEKSLDSKDSELQRSSYYNMGNTHYRMGKLIEAIDDYKKCLDINPDDEDAKYNIEFVRKKIKENLKKEDSKQKESQQKESNAIEQQKQGGSSQGQQQEEKDQKSAGAQKSEEDKEKEKKEQKPQAQQEDKGENKDVSDNRPQVTGSEEKSSSEEERKDEMSKEDAVRLLDALRDDEKNLQKELINQPVEGRYRVDKDW